MNLLATSMNVDTVVFLHPAYVEIIKQMSQLDAIVFEEATKIRQLPCARIVFKFDTKVYTEAMPRIFFPDFMDKVDPFLLSSIIQNLCRLGLLTHTDDTIIGYNYELLRENSYVKNRFEIYEKINTNVELKI